MAGLLRQFRTSLGVGGTLKNGAIELQGDHRDALVERLRAQGYAAKAAGG
jgi:translation initiation factor 1